MRGWWLVVAGCGGALPEAPIASPLPAPQLPHVPYAMLPGELGDPGVLEKIPHHTRLAMHGRAYLQQGREEIAREVNQGADEILPVLGEARDYVRVVADDDDARLALWIERADLATTVLLDVELADERGVQPANTGVYFSPGVALYTYGRRGPMREIGLANEELDTIGWVRAELVGEVWTGPEPRARNRERVRRELPPNVVLRTEASASAPPVAKLREKMLATPIATRGEWTLVEIEDTGARIRGYLPTAIVAVAPEGQLGAFGSTGGYGISDTDHVPVTAGTCLYDHLGGEVIGVNMKSRDRYGFFENGSAHVYVNTRWGLTTLVVVAVGDKQWESCAAPGSAPGEHRRALRE